MRHLFYELTTFSQSWNIVEHVCKLKNVLKSPKTHLSLIVNFAKMVKMGDFGLNWRMDLFSDSKLVYDLFSTPEPFNRENNDKFKNSTKESIKLPF